MTRLNFRPSSDNLWLKYVNLIDESNFFVDGCFFVKKKSNFRCVRNNGEIALWCNLYVLF